MEVVGRAKQDARAEGANSRVIPWMVCTLELHSYMEVVGRAKQDARAEGANPRIATLHLCLPKNAPYASISLSFFLNLILFISL